MDIQKLKIALEPWVRVDSWHSSHSLDGERFHRALKDAFNKLGTSIAYDDFEVAIDELAKELHPKILPSFREEIVQRFAKRAENIGSYLYDNSK